ncbi:MAG TPA: YdjY domain-containing protein [Verrucomicrobiae bacterium]
MNFNGLRRMGIWTATVWICFAGNMFAADGGQTGSAANELKLGEVRVDAVGRAISFPAAVNQRVGAVEYWLVHETGKVHESIFRTSVGAKEIHTAALLFSEKGTNTGGGAAKLKVKAIEVSWMEDGKEQKFNAADLILDKKKNRALKETKWAYRGSRLVDGVFLAQRDGSLIAIMEDRDALIDQDTPDASDDKNWEPVAEKLPGIASTVVITIRFANN